MSGLELQGPLHNWHDTALAGRWTHGDEVHEVMAFLGPDQQDSGVVHTRSKPWIGRTGPGVLPLLAVVQLGKRHAWLYPQTQALGLERIVHRRINALPLRVAAEIVAQVAALLHQLSGGSGHPGPSCADLGLQADGTVLICGFATPYPNDPALVCPEKGTEDETLVWRLGILLARLVGGTMPAVSDESAHQARVRRLLIHAMSREGHQFTERYRDWLTGMLHWAPGQRPALSSLTAGLNKLGAEVGGPDLTMWAAQNIDNLRNTSERNPHGAPPPTPSGSFQPWNDPSLDELTEDDHTGHSAPPLSLGTTLPGLAVSDLPPRDDATSESTLQQGPRMAMPQAEPGTMPIGIGPPAEAMKEDPTLPAGFLEPSVPAMRAPVTTATLVSAGLLLLLVGMTLGLIALAGLFLWFNG